MDHHYTATIVWAGDKGTGTSGYTDYGRDHRIRIDGKADMDASSDPHFRGDASKHNPEDLFLSSIASCHMLWYLHLCADHGIIVKGYTDKASGLMQTTANGSGKFTKMVLRPEVMVTEESMMTLAGSLHHQAHAMCFLANSVDFEIIVEPQIHVLK